MKRRYDTAPYIGPTALFDMFGAVAPLVVGLVFVLDLLARAV